MAIIDTLFMTKTAENHTLWGRTYLYSPYKGVPPPPGQPANLTDDFAVIRTRVIYKMLILDVQTSIQQLPKVCAYQNKDKDLV